MLWLRQVRRLQAIVQGWMVQQICSGNAATLLLGLPSGRLSIQRHSYDENCAGTSCCLKARRLADATLQAFLHGLVFASEACTYAQLFTYACCCCACRASPRRKVLTLSSSSVHVATDARQHAALEAAAAADPTATPLGPLQPCVAAAGSRICAGSSSQGGSATRPRVLGPAWESFAAGGEDADIEVVLKGFNDSWTVCRHTRSGRQLTAVVESDKEGLPGVMRKVQGFCDCECLGVFEGLS